MNTAKADALNNPNQTASHTSNKIYEDLNLSIAKVRTQILKGLRKDWSQMAMSRRLGYKFNQFHRWESGSKRILWKDFCQICEVCQLPLAEILKETFCFQSKEPQDTQELLNRLLHLNGIFGLKENAKRLRCHPSSLRRWLEGTQDPPLDKILLLISERPQVFNTFFAKIFPDTPLPHWEKTMRQIKVTLNHPLAAAIEALLTTETGRSKINATLDYLSEALQAPREIIARTLQAQINEGRIKLEKGQWQLDTKTQEIPNTDKYMILKMVSYWTLRTALLFSYKQKNNTKSNSSRQTAVSYRIVAMSTTAQRKINNLLFDCERAILQTLEADNEVPTEARGILIHQFPIELNIDNEKPHPWGKDLFDFVTNFETL